MNKRKILAIASVVTTVGSILVFVGNGCSGQFQVSEQASSTNSAVDATANTNSNLVDFIPGTKTVSVVYAQQALDQLSACAGVQTPSDDTQRMYESKKGQISVYGSAETITSPMMMAVISISGELCNDLINQEKKGAPRIFKGWDLNSTSIPANGVVTDSISRLALSCWQRRENSGEQNAVLDAAYSVTNGEPMAAAKTALMICTTMLSSLNSLLN